MNVFVIGAGTMGEGITQVLSCSNLVETVYVYSRAEVKAQKLLQKCRERLDRLVVKGLFDASFIDTAVDKIKLVNSFEMVSVSEFVIEAVVESYDVKNVVYSELYQFITEKTVVASNTSALSITALGSRLPVPGNFIGLHFFNPAPLMELVEVISGALTSDNTRAKALEFISALGKTAVVVEEAPGFIVNRMLIPMLNEAVTILAEGVASRDDIDSAMLLGARHPMGPLKLADMIGNDVVLSIMDVIFKESGDAKYRAHPLLRKMVRAGLLGQKVGKGFYEY